MSWLPKKLTKRSKNVFFAKNLGPKGLSTRICVVGGDRVNTFIVVLMGERI